MPGAELESRAAELAYHFSEAQTLLGSEKLVRYSILAGEQALAVYAHGEAQEHFHKALTAKEGQPKDEELADILFGLGRARAAMSPRSKAQEVWDIFVQAFDYYVEIGNIHKALEVAGYPNMFGPYVTGQTRVIERAFELAPADSRQMGPLLLGYGIALYYELGDYDKAEETLDRAIEIAERERDTALQIRILAHAAAAGTGYRRFEESAQRGLRVLELLSKAEDPVSENFAQVRVANHAVMTGNVDRARHYLAESVVAAEKSGHHVNLTLSYYLSAALARLQGDWQAVRHFTDKALNLSKNEALCLSLSSLLHHELGEPEEGNALIEQLRDTVPLTAPEAGFERMVVGESMALITQTHGSDCEADTANRVAQIILSSSRLNPGNKASSGAILGIIAAYRQDAGLAHEQYEILKSEIYKVTNVFLINLDRTLGLLAHIMGRFDAAASHFEDSLAFCRKAGYRPELAWTCHDYASLRHALRGVGVRRYSSQGVGQDDREGALALLDEANDISTELGMRPLNEKVLALKVQVESLRSSAPIYPTA